MEKTLNWVERKFNARWFLLSIFRYKRYFLECMAGALILQILGLAMPAITQVVVDKILPNKAETTLTVLAVGYVFVALFQFAIYFLRGLVSNQTTNKIDILLGGRLFRHIMRLPLVFFESRRVGDTLMRVVSLNSIREFLTGQALNSFLDSIFAVVYFALMYWYSPGLTLVAFASVPLQLFFAIRYQPGYLKRIEELWAIESNSKSFLVEATNSIQTIKAMAAEPLFNRRWEDISNKTAQAAFNVGMTGNAIENTTQMIQRVTGVLILWYGGYLVIMQQMSLGQLIAFSMLFSQISQPLGNLFNLWPQAQQALMAAHRMSDILHTPREFMNNKPQQRLPFRGSIVFEAVSFGYNPDKKMVIENFSFGMMPGERIGFVGRSGSGKSTVAKLAQRLYLPQQGKIMIDGMDIALLDPEYLRSQIGVVLQENYLFKGSIRDNIAVSSPGATMAAICKAAETAGAHEFILELREGYDTDVGERGAQLSGGQRQRIAIARALLTNPRILIFDEATSALDYQSERIILNNLDDICRDRTVIIIAHRLSTVRNCTRIVTLDQGKIVECGSHEQLLSYGGFYAWLNEQQR